MCRIQGLKGRVLRGEDSSNLKFILIKEKGGGIGAAPFFVNCLYEPMLFSESSSRSLELTGFRNGSRVSGNCGEPFSGTKVFEYIVGLSGCENAGSN